MSAEDAFVNNVLVNLVGIGGVMVVHLGLIRLVTHYSPEASSFRALAFPKYEVSWFLISYEGIALLAAYMLLYGDRTTPVGVLLMVLAVAVFVAIAAVVCLMARRVHRRMQALRGQRVLEYRQHANPVSTYWKLYQELARRFGTGDEVGKQCAVEIEDIDVDRWHVASLDADTGLDDALHLMSGGEVGAYASDAPRRALAGSGFLIIKHSLLPWRGNYARLLLIDADGLATYEPQVGNAADEGNVATATRIEGLPRTNKWEWANVKDLSFDADEGIFRLICGNPFTPPLHFSAASVELNEAIRAQFSLCLMSHLGAKNASLEDDTFEQTTAAEAVSASSPPSPPASPPEPEPPPAIRVSTLRGSSRSLRTGSASPHTAPDDSKEATKLNESLNSDAGVKDDDANVMREESSAVRRKSWTPFDNAHHPEAIGKLGKANSFGKEMIKSPTLAIGELSNRLGRPWGLRHSASALHWYASLSNEDKRRILATHRKAQEAVRKSGAWKVSPSDAGKDATKFMGGFGELFIQRHQGHRFQLLPNYLYFVVEVVHMTLRVLVLTTVTNPDVQSALLITLDALELILFVVQMPYSDRWLNVDFLFSKTVNLVTICVLTVSGPDSDVLTSLVMNLNLSALYWIIATQMARLLVLAWRAFEAAVVLLSCFGKAAHLASKGKVTPRKLSRRESRSMALSEIKTELGPHVVRVFRSGMKLKKAITGLKNGAEDGEEDQEEELEADGVGDNEVGGPKEVSIDEQLEQKDVQDYSTVANQMQGEYSSEMQKAGVRKRLYAELQPMVERRGLPWEIIRMAIERVDSVEELELLLEDPPGFLAHAAYDMAFDLVTERLRPIVTAFGINWNPVKAVLDELDTLEKLQAALTDPREFLKEAGFVTTRDVLVPKVLDQLRKHYKELEIPWDQIEASVKGIESSEELEAILDDPRSFVRKLANLEIEALLPKLLDTVRPLAASRSLPFDQVEKLAHEIDTVEEMEAAVADPEAFLKRAADLAIEAMLPKLLDTVRPLAASRSLPFDQVEKLAHEIDTVEEMEAAVADPEAFLKRTMLKLR